MKNLRRVAFAAAFALGLGTLSTPPALDRAEANPSPSEQYQPYATPIGTGEPASRQHVSASANELTDAAGDVVPLVADTIFSLGISESLYASSARDTLSSSHGFAGQVVNEADRSITLYWKGDPPEHVNTYLATAAARDVEVKVVKGASHTRAAAQAAVERLVASDLSEEVGIGWVSVNYDGSGITVHMIGKVPSGVVKSQIEKSAGLDAASISYEADAGKIAPTAGSRADDVAPWKGGARIWVGSGPYGVCSTGFAVLWQGVYGRLLSANHCDPDGGAEAGSGPAVDGGGTTIGDVHGRPAIDSLRIDPTASPATTPKIYVGTWSSSSQATVKGWASNWTGQGVCASGATTGTDCGTIVDDAIGVPGLSGSWYVRAEDEYGGVMAGEGDSGGPVYRTVSGGKQARGTIIGGSDEVGCGSHNPDVSNPTCYSDMVYVPISVVLNTWGYELETG